MLLDEAILDGLDRLSFFQLMSLPIEFVSHFKLILSPADVFSQFRFLPLRSSHVEVVSNKGDPLFRFSPLRLSPIRVVN